MIYKLKIAETPNTATDIFCRFDWLVRLILAGEKGSEKTI
jgi:hypothetical protein